MYMLLQIDGKLAIELPKKLLDSFARYICVGVVLSPSDGERFGTIPKLVSLVDFCRLVKDPNVNVHKLRI
jgi:ligand-binding sensor protein